MKKTLLIFLFPLLSIGQTQIGTDIVGKAANDLSGSSVSLSADGSIIAIGAPKDFNNDSGSVRVYKNISGSWTQIGSDIVSEAAGVESGFSVSLSADGSIVAIGAPDYSGIVGSGSVRVYKNVSDVWTQIGSDIIGDTYSQSGSSVSISADGTIVAIGSPANNQNSFVSGSVRVYQNVSGSWNQIGSDINGQAPYESMGSSVSLSSDGSIVAMGAPYDGAHSGLVRVYQNISGSWTQIGSDIIGEANSDQSGSSISLSSDGSIVAIGAIGNDDNGNFSGSVRVYKNVSGIWTQIGEDIDGEASDESGTSISLSADGSIIAIGSPSNSANDVSSGRVRVYKNVSGVWIKRGTNIDGDDYYDRIGSSVSISADGNIVATGAVKLLSMSGDGINTGYVRVYNLTTVLISDSFVLSNSSVYPNPSSDIVNINLSENLTLEKVNVYNTLGQLVKTEKSNAISVSPLSHGTYYFEIITDKGKGTKTVLVK